MVSKASGGQQPTTWGFCKFLKAREHHERFSDIVDNVTTREQNEIIASSSNRGQSTFFLLELSENNKQQQRILCRLSGALPRSEPHAVLCYDKSVSAVEQQLGAVTVYIEKHFDRLYFIHNNQTGNDDHNDFVCPEPNDHSYIKISPYMKQSTAEQSATNCHASYVYRLESKPCALLSIFLQRQRPPQTPKSSTSSELLGLPEPLETLFWSCLKRQLVGCIILFHPEQVTTQLTLSALGIVVHLQVTSVLPLQQHKASNKESKVFVILPSTRITVTFDDQDSGNDDQNALANDLELDSNAILSPVARRLVDTIRCMRLPPDTNLSRSLLLSGPPGVGKTHAVRAAFQYGQQRGPVQLWSIRGSELLANDGQNSTASQALQQTFHQAFQFANQSRRHVALLFLDECDALVSSNMMEEMDATSAAAISTLAYLLDQLNDPSNVSSGWKRVLVVAATNRLDVIPSFLRRPGRLDREMVLSPPTAVERLALLKHLLATSSSTESGGEEDKLHQQEDLLPVADACVGYVPADLVALVRRATFLSLQEQGVGGRSANVTPTLLFRAMADVGASALRDAALSAPPKMGWDDVAGDPGGAKTALRQAVEWPRTRRASYLRLGLTPPRGILLHGPPGCAKTSLARAAAGASGVAFLTYSPADVYSSSYVGEAEAVVRNAFSLARSAAPCILFFDEIDAILGSSSSDGNSNFGGMHRRSSAESRVLSTFLNEMDGVDGSPEDGVLVLAATNRPWTLDAALLRPGRLEKIIFVPPPDLEGRKSILQMSCPRASADCHDNSIDFDYLASPEISGLMTGAEIVGACREAASQVLRNTIEHGTPPIVTQEHLESVFRAVKPLLSNPATMDEYQRFWKQNKQVGN